MWQLCCLNSFSLKDAAVSDIKWKVCCWFVISDIPSKYVQPLENSFTNWVVIAINLIIIMMDASQLALRVNSAKLASMNCIVLFLMQVKPINVLPIICSIIIRMPATYVLWPMVHICDNFNQTNELLRVCNIFLTDNSPLIPVYLSTKYIHANDCCYLRLKPLGYRNSTHLYPKEMAQLKS